LEKGDVQKQKGVWRLPGRGNGHDKDARKRGKIEVKLCISRSCPEGGKKSHPRNKGVWERLYTHHWCKIRGIRESCRREQCETGGVKCKSRERRGEETSDITLVFHRETSMYREKIQRWGVKNTNEGDRGARQGRGDGTRIVLGAQKKTD